jgi:hypothetical protein
MQESSGFDIGTGGLTEWRISADFRMTAADSFPQGVTRHSRCCVWPGSPLSAEQS